MSMVREDVGGEAEGQPFESSEGMVAEDGVTTFIKEQSTVQDTQSAVEDTSCKFDIDVIHPHRNIANKHHPKVLG